MEESVCYEQWKTLGKTLLAFSLLHLYSKAKLAFYFRYLLSSYFCIPVPYDEKDVFFFFFFFLVLVLEGLSFSQNHSTSASLALVVEA